MSKDLGEVTREPLGEPGEEVTGQSKPPVQRPRGWECARNSRKPVRLEETARRQWEEVKIGRGQGRICRDLWVMSVVLCPALSSSPQVRLS